MLVADGGFGLTTGVAATQNASITSEVYSTKPLRCCEI
jgi:hypothetical protein